MTNQTEEGAALAACPFCGAIPTVKAVARDWWKLLIDHREGCMLSGHLDDVITPQDDESKAGLIGMWNRRAAVPTSEGCTSDGWTDVAQGLPEPQMPVLLDIGLKYPIRAMWVAAKTLPVGGGDDDDFGEYVEDDDEWYCPEGWYEWNQYENRHWSVGAKPLRWMYLPTTNGDKP